MRKASRRFYFLFLFVTIKNISIFIQATKQPLKAPHAMIITTPQNARFDTSKFAKSNICMVLDDNGNQKMDTLRVTGRMTIVEEFRQQVAMIEVETSFGAVEVHEDFLWQ